MENKSFGYYNQRLLCCFLLAFQGLYGSEEFESRSSTNALGTIGVGLGVSALVVSAAQGVYNIRKYHALMSQYQLDYCLTSPVYVKDYPLQVVQNVICAGLPALDLTHQNKHGLAVLEIRKKIAIFDSLDIQAVWSFNKFKNIMPHTSMNEAYCVSKSYLASFGYPTLKFLKDSIAYQMIKIEQDFQQLAKLTDLPWYFVQIPKTFEEFQKLEAQLNDFSDCCGAYALLGACGYSAVHNGQRVKNYLLSLSKMYAFLSNFQELLATCIDNDEIQLIQSQGVLQFSLQHVHYVQERR